MAWKYLAIAAAIALSWVLGAAPAAAQEPVPELFLGFQPESAIGEDIAVAAYLLDPAGNPIRGELVTFHMDAEFMHTLARAEIGRAWTDENGLALLVYTPKSEGERRITARFAGNRVFAPAEVSESLLVAPGPATYREESPFRMPGANIQIVVVVLATVWGIYLVVVGLFWRVSRAKSVEEPWVGVRR